MTAGKKEAPASHIPHKDIADWTTTAEGIAAIIGVQRETVTRLAQVEGMPKQARGKYNIVECIQWIMDRERDKSGSETPEDKKARIAVAKQQEIKLKIDNAQQLNELLPAAIVSSAFAAMSSELANKLDGLAPRMASELSTMDQPSHIQKALFDECRAIRAATAAAFSAIAGDIDSGGDSSTAAQ